MTTLALTILVLSSAVQFAYPQLSFKNHQPSPRVVGGQEATPHQFPFQAFLRVYNTNGYWYCGGALVSKNYVLTSAQCCFNAVYALTILGAHNISIESTEPTQITINSSKLIMHEQFDFTSKLNDIALVELIEPAPLGQNVALVGLPKNDSTTYEGEAATIIGWGLVSGDDKYIPDVLEYVDTPIIANEDCVPVDPIKEDVVVDSNICTGSSEAGTCNGDLGSPLIVDGVQVGIVSYWSDQCKGPSVFTRVSSYSDWIDANSDVNFKKSSGSRIVSCCIMILAALLSRIFT